MPSLYAFDGPEQPWRPIKNTEEPQGQVFDELFGPLVSEIEEAADRLEEAVKRLNG